MKIRVGTAGLLRIGWCLLGASHVKGKKEASQRLHESWWKRRGIQKFYR